MLIQNSRAKTGALAGAISILIALTAMELISWMIAPTRMLTGQITYMLMQKSVDFTGSLIDFLFSSNPRFRFTVVILLVYLIAAAYLGKWTAMVRDTRAMRALQSGAILLLTTFTLMFIVERFWFDFYLQEMLLSLVIPFFIFSVVLSWLLAETSTQRHWQIAGLTAAIGLIFIIYEVTENQPY